MKKNLNYLVILLITLISIHESNSLKLKGNKQTNSSPFDYIGQYSTPVSSSDTRIMSTPEYVHPFSIDKSSQTALILNPNYQALGNIIHRRGLTESPNYLSTVLSYHPTSILTKSNFHLPNSPTFDLDSIKKTRILSNNKVIFNMNRIKDSVGRVNRNLRSVYDKNINKPPSGPISLSHPVVTVNKYKMNLLYNGNSKTSPVLNSSSMMKSVEDKIKKIENLDKKEIKQLLNTMKQEKNLLEKENEQLYSSINMSENQINLILSSLKEDLNETQKAMNSLIVPIPQQLKPVIFKEINEEFTKSLNGFNVDKTKFPHLKNIDSKELVQISDNIKNKLSANKNFYLHNDDFILK